MAVELAEHGRVVAGRESALYLGRTRDGIRFAARVVGGVARHHGGHASGFLAQLLDRPGEPLLDGAVHQQVGELEEEDDGQERKQEGAHHHAGAELRAEHTDAALGVELEQVASEDKGQRDEDEEDERAQGGEEQRLL